MIVGEYIEDISMGLENVHEILHGTVVQNNDKNNDKKDIHHDSMLGEPNDSSSLKEVGIKNGQTLDDTKQEKEPMTLNEITSHFTTFLHTLHDTLKQHKRERIRDTNINEIWQSYHYLAVQTLYPWDKDYLSRMPQRRDDNSIFLSIATYRDENCINTLTWAYEKARDPDNLFVGLVQQNCEADCKSGVLADLTMENVKPDSDCLWPFVKVNWVESIV